MVFWLRASMMKRRAAFLASQSFVVLAIRVPKDNEKTAQSMESFFAALHGIYRNDPAVQEHIALEVVARKDSIIFYLFTPLHLKEFIESQLYAQYPDLTITQVSDYAREVDLAGMHVATSRIKLTKEDVYPIKTFTTFEVDPLAGITSVMGSLEAGEQMWLQMVVRPVGDNWQNKGVSYVKGVRSGKIRSGFRNLGRVGRAVYLVAQELARPGSALGNREEPPKLSAPEEAALKAVESKITKLGYETVFRSVTISQDPNIARARTQALVAALKQFNTTNLNGFTAGEIKLDDYRSWEQYINREFEEKGSILNIEELASVYHFPSQTVEVNAISRSGSKQGEAPHNLPLKDQVDPKDLTVLGRTDFRNKSQEFGIRMDDRKRHIYIIGKSGTGKSTLLENMIIDDVMEGRGVVLVDPHGELADKVVDSIPDYRIQDAVVLDPSDREWPIAFNLLEQVGDDYKGMVASGFVGIFKKIFGNSWGPRLEYILRNTVLALLDMPNSTMLGIPRMLTEQQFRNEVIENIKDTVIRDFWVNEFAAMDAKQRTEAVAPILNKVGQFLSTSTIRNIVGQPKSTIDIRRIMDEQKILVVNLSKGKIGEDNMALLGAMIVTKVQLAAMSRANVPVNQRPDCFLYVDEFQNFATDSFATILSEARKYNLGLTIAHQYIAQLTEEVRDAVIGNVGSMILFRVGAPDAEALQKEFAPVFDVADMVNLEKAHVYVKLLIDGLSMPAFSAQTLPPKHIEASYRDQVITYSREHYSRPRVDVEDTIEETGGYKKKREAEQAAKLAASILQGAPPPAQPNAVPRQAQPSGQVAPAPQATPLQTNSENVRFSAGAPAKQAVAQPTSRPLPQPLPAPASFVPQPTTPPASPPHQLGQGSSAGERGEREQMSPIVVAPSIPQTEMIQTEGNEAPKVPKPEKPEKPPRVMDGWVYREVAQRGGHKWFLGEPEQEYLARKEAKEREKQRQLEEAEQNGEVPLTNSPEIAENTPPATTSPTEQIPNGYSLPINQVSEGSGRVATQ